MASTKSVAAALLTLIGALIVVGILNAEIVRHIVQTAPVWIAVALGLRGVPLTNWAALPVALIWLTLMVLIWLYLLGIANVLGGGTFTPIEIALTIVIAAASAVALVISFRLPWTKPGLGLLTFLVVAALQLALVKISFQSPISHDAELLRALR